MATSGVASLLQRQLREIQRSKDLQGISCGLVDDANLFEWEVMLMINDDCKYYGGGNFCGRLVFPQDYPHSPPSFNFRSPIPFHPNIYHPSGVLCISILHPPGSDQYGYEDANERWSPVQTPETILLSIISLFHDPNVDSPANIEAGKLLREESEGKHKEFRKMCRRCVRESLGDY